VRAYAAGYLHKQEVLTVTGPYAYTRNPLYLGSGILALGAELPRAVDFRLNPLLFTSLCFIPS